MPRYAATIFLSAFLLFQVQPLFGKHLLPWFGGTPAVWTTCMLFFQVVLLLGYSYAHWSISRLTPRQQGIVHLCLLAAALLFLPAIPGAEWKPSGEESPTWRILAVLARTIGLPYLMLASTAPLVQAWFSRDPALAGRSPYRLYALSNFGSLLGLLSYPFVVEPNLTLRAQGYVWSGLFIGFVALCGWQAWRVRGGASVTADATTQAVEAELPGAAAPPGAPGVFDRLLWLLLAACGSVMLLATTNHMTQDVASVPFLWVLPLSLYLISFVITFDSPRWYWRPLWAVLMPLSIAGAFVAMNIGVGLNLTAQVVLYCAALLATCMVLHGELVRIKPAARYLTGFYLMISLGGAAGGAFVSLLAPSLFSGYWEYPGALVASCILFTIAVYRQSAGGGPIIRHLTVANVLAACALGGFVWAYNEIKQLNDFNSMLHMGASQRMEDVASDERFQVLRDWIHRNVGTLDIDLRYQVLRITDVGWQVLALLGIAIALVMMMTIQRHTQRRMWFGVIVLGVATVSIMVLVMRVADPLEWRAMAKLGGGVVALVTITILVHRYLPAVDWRRYVIAGVGGVAILLAGAFGAALYYDATWDTENTLVQTRNFYGVLRIDEETDYEGIQYRTLLHGRIRHGMQLLDGDYQHAPTSYYAEESGVGVAVRTMRQLRGSNGAEGGEGGLRIGVIGLGTASMAAYGRAGDYMLFYEINDEVLRLSDEYFTYRKNTPAKTDVALGDARITMEREQARGESRQFDVLVIDAFSGDAVPLHLLTREAFAVYFHHLKPDGVLVVHISNQYLDLAPLMHDLAEDAGKQAVIVENVEDETRSIDSSTWVVIGSHQPFFDSPLVVEHAMEWPQRDPRKLVFTDDFSNLFHVLAREFPPPEDDAATEDESGDVEP